MTDLVELELSATPESALNKLTRANIPVYRLKKRGTKLYLSVNREYIEKVFAIFGRPCYNIRIRRKSKSMRFAAFFRRRVGLFIGAAVFIAATVFSQNVVFKIKITGSGSYLKPQVLAVANECGVKEWSLCKSADTPLLQAKILALPGVNFCSVQREGAYLIIDVRTEESDYSLATSEPLLSPADGVIRRIVTVCGTQLKQEGESVKKGETLIGTYTLSEDGESSPCMAVGFAEICVTYDISLYYDKESDKNREDALSSTALYSENVIEKSVKVKSHGEGVVYEVNFTYLVTATVNMR